MITAINREISKSVEFECRIPKTKGEESCNKSYSNHLTIMGMKNYKAVPCYIHINTSTNRNRNALREEINRKQEELDSYIWTTAYLESEGVSTFGSTFTTMGLQSQLNDLYKKL